MSKPTKSLRVETWKMTAGNMRKVAVRDNLGRFDGATNLRGTVLGPSRKKG